MELTNLEARGDKFLDTLSLIESSFGYSGEHSFAVDFFPLMKESNRKNSWVILDNDKPVAHAAVIERRFRVKDRFFTTLFIGGVAVDETFRGKGYSSFLLNHIFKTYPSPALYILWSDKMDMYKKYGFSPCVELFEDPQTEGESSFHETSFAEISERSFQAIKELYQSLNEIRAYRSEEEWEDVKSISSARLFVKCSKEVPENYFIMGKGQDLEGVIHEYGSLKDKKEMVAHGRLWSTLKSPRSTPLYGSLLKAGEKKAFSELIHAVTSRKLAVKEVGSQVEFEFESQELSMPLDDFMQGVFGPGRFEELEGLPKLFISGLDSV